MILRRHLKVLLTSQKGLKKEIAVFDILSEITEQDHLLRLLPNFYIWAENRSIRVKMAGILNKSGICGNKKSRIYKKRLKISLKED